MSEFHANGLKLSRLFADGTERVDSFPLRANGTLTDVQMRHLLLQFSSVAAVKSARIFVLAMQKQRSAVLRSIAARVKHLSQAQDVARKVALAAAFAAGHVHEHRGTCLS